MKSNRYNAVLSKIKLLLLLCVVMKSVAVQAQSKPDKEVNLDKIPPRIIRACCAFGYDLKLWAVPFVNIDQVISVADLDEHHYMGKKSEGVGTIYTKRGGFIDIGHLRDQIDWTRFLYTTILEARGKGKVTIRLRKEAGRKTLYLNVPTELSDSDCISLAGKIAYDFSLWHEISTWFGASTIPFVPEKFSSFSVEDVYSNLLGIHIGMKTLHSKLPFNKVATQLLASSLDSLGIVKTAKETYDAYDAVHNLWYTNEKRIPRIQVALKRDLDVLSVSRPWLVPNQQDTSNEPVVLEVPLLNSKDEKLTDFYEFTIDLNGKFPIEELFPGYKSKRINQDDFSVLMNRISEDLKHLEQHIKEENEK